MVYCFDIDGTLCSNTYGDYEKAVPDTSAIACLNALYEAGHEIVLFTARGSTTGIDWRALTERQLRGWNVKYHRLLFGKPDADVYVDDRAVNSADWLLQMRQDEMRGRT
jgi:trehalose-6-phosphatase